jgi:spore coat protein H
MIAMGIAAASTSAEPVNLKGAAEAAPLAASQLPVYELTVSAVEWENLQRAPRSDERRPAKFRANDEEYSVEIRHRGDWARSWPKKPLKIFFEKDKDFEGQNVINLNPNWRDPAFIREQLAYHIYVVCGVPAPKTRMVKVIINGQFHGVFLEVEQPAKPFLKRVGLKGAVVYKCNSRELKSDESDLGAEDLFRAQYEKQTRKDESYEDLQSFCHGLAVAPDVAGFFNARVDLNRYVNFLAGSALVQNWDWFSKNHFLVHDTEGSKKWIVVPWDLDRTLGDHWAGPFDAADLPLRLGTRAQPSTIGWNKLFDAFYKVPSLRKRLLDRIEALLEKEFTEEKLFPVLDRWESEISADVALDRKRWPNLNAGNIHAGIAGVKQYIKDRRAFLFGEIKAQRVR